METRDPTAWLRVKLAVIVGGPPPAPAFTAVTATVSSLFMPGLKTSFVPTAIVHGHPVLGFVPVMVLPLNCAAVTPFSGIVELTTPGLVVPVGTAMAVPP